MIDLGINAGGNGNHWINFKVSEDSWFYSEGEMDLEKQVFMLDPDTVQAGWGKVGNFSPTYIWDKKANLPDPNPGGNDPEEADLWRRAVTAEIYIHNEGAFTWTTVGVGEKIGFNELIQAVWIDKDKQEGKLPVIQYTGSRNTTFRTKVPEFKIERLSERPEEFGSRQITNGEESKPEPLIKEDLPQSESESEIPF